ncbi:MAG: helix-turn-helix domain-containing protein [Balneolaceae bacterium]
MTTPTQHTPKKISILIFEDIRLTAVTGALDILMGANECFAETGLELPFDIELVSEKMKTIRVQLPAQFTCHKTVDEVEETDLIIVPSFMGDAEQSLKKYRNLVNWIETMSRKGSEVASLCRGSYFLAEAGLLNGKSCTSHWMSVDDMAQRYPEITVLADEIITDQDGVYTSGGAFSSIHLVLYLIEKFCGREMAIQVSKIFSIDMDRESQAHFAVFRGQKGHKDEEILKSQLFIEQNYQNPITVEEIAGQVNMSRRNFIRRFKKATQNTPLEYIQRVKVEAAKKGLEQGNQNISSLVYDVGYNDSKSFRNVFKRFTGLTPAEYRSKYSRSKPSTKLQTYAAHSQSL